MRLDYVSRAVVIEGSTYVNAGGVGEGKGGKKVAGWSGPVGVLVVATSKPFFFAAKKKTMRGEGCLLLSQAKADRNAPHWLLAALGKKNE